MEVVKSSLLWAISSLGIYVGSCLSLYGAVTCEMKSGRSNWYRHHIEPWPMGMVWLSIIIIFLLLFLFLNSSECMEILLLLTFNRPFIFLLLPALPLRLYISIYRSHLSLIRRVLVRISFWLLVYNSGKQFGYFRYFG